MVAAIAVRPLAGTDDSVFLVWLPEPPTLYTGEAWTVAPAARRREMKAVFESGDITLAATNGLYVWGWHGAHGAVTVPELPAEVWEPLINGEG
jgi:hypothetical protein